MQINFIQMVLIIIFSIWCIYDYLNTKLFYHCGQCVVMGWVTGLILGSGTVGLTVGATLQLMTLGVAAWGGSSIPDYPLGAMMGTIVAIASGGDVEYGILVGVPVAVFAVQLDVFVRMLAVFFARAAKNAAASLRMKESYTWIATGWLTWSVKYLVPLILLFIVGPDKVVALIDKVPAPITAALKVVAGMLPAVGIGILLRYMNAKENVSWVILGFAVATYLGLNVTQAAVIGLAIALIAFKMNTGEVSVATNGGDDDEL